VSKLALAIAALLTVVGCSGPTQSAPSLLAGTIVVGVVDDAPGFADGDHNTAGFDIDLMNWLHYDLHRQVTTTILTSQDRESYLLSRKADLVIATFSITEQRNEDGIDFAGPYLATPEALLVRNDEHLTDNSIRGKSVCTVTTTTGAGVVIHGANMSTHEPTTQDCVELLREHQTDAVFNDAAILYGYEHAYPGLKVIQSGTYGEQQYYGIGLLGGHHADCEKLDAAIAEYLRTQWRQDFLSNFPAAAAAYPGSNPAVGDYESVFKPKDTDSRSLSCQL
jgi:glutamate transport system substrate-binding protein